MSPPRAYTGSLFAEGIGAAEDLLGNFYRLNVAKALDPLDPRDFVVIVQRLGRALVSVSRDAEAHALRNALGTLDVDWPNMTARARERILRAAQDALEGAAAKVLPRVDHVFEVEAKTIVAGSRQAAVRRFGLHIAAETSRTDERIARFVRTSESNFVRDAYGRRNEEFSARAREIVAAGHERGLGRADITEELSSQLTAVTGRPASYWEVVATSFANRGRTYTQLAAFDDAGVERFRFDAVLDQVTCFPAGVRVATADGPIPIEQVTPGRGVWTHLGRLAPVRAVRATRQPRSMCVVWTGKGRIRTTANHPFLVRRAGRLAWVAACELTTGDRVLARRSV